MSNSKGTTAKRAKKFKKRSLPVRIIIITLKLLAVLILTIGFTGAGFAVGALMGYSKTAPDISDDQLNLKTLTTLIYDEDNHILDKLTGKDNKNMERVEDKDIPKYLKEAIIAIEDERFEQHPGVDLEGLMRAVFKKVKNPSSSMQGGSTITMQLVRNITQNFKRSIPRKIQEWWAAYRLEQRMPKWKILESYLNIIFMGHGCYGVQTASKTYFGKPVSGLSLAECAMLAGITNSPGDYDPFDEEGLENAHERKVIILDKMLELGKINGLEYNQALKEKIRIVDPEQRTTEVKPQTYFVDQVINDVATALMEQKNYSREMAMAIIYNNGLSIHTTQDPDVQKILDDVYDDDEFFPLINQEAKKLQEQPQSAMVIIDPKTGQVKGIRGGYGEKKGSNTLNRATQLKRQPGSSIKPIAVYGPAIDLRLITPARVVDDIPVYMMTSGKDKDKPYPQNYDGVYGGLTSIRNGIKASINVVAAKVWRDILGPARSLEYLKKVGIDRPNEGYISLVMGGLYEGVSPLQMASAYVPFCNKGVYYEPITFTEVKDTDGKVIIDNDPEYSAVYDETTAYLMTDMLKEVVLPKNSPYIHGGTAQLCKIQGGKMPVAGKTGTTSENIDKWFVGYTPYYVAATWYGYDNKYERKAIKLVKTEYTQAQRIWQAVMERLHEGLEPIDFEMPEGLVKKNICIYSGQLATELCAKDPRGDATRQELFIKGTEPKEFCTLHVMGSICNASKDQYGRSLLAGPYCPFEQIITAVFIQRPEPYTPVKPDEKFPLDLIYDLPAGEYCTVHGAPPLPIEPTTGLTETTGTEETESDELLD